MFSLPSFCERASATAFEIQACICDIGTICSLGFSERLLPEGSSFEVLPPFDGFFNFLDFFPPRFEPEGSSWRCICFFNSTTDRTKYSRTMIVLATKRIFCFHGSHLCHLHVKIDNYMSNLLQSTQLKNYNALDIWQIERQI